MKLDANLEKELMFENKREQLIDAEFALMKMTGQISGEVKNILYLEDINERRQNITKVEDSLGKLLVEILRISDALKLNFNEIIKGKIEM